MRRTVITSLALVALGVGCSGPVCPAMPCTNSLTIAVHFGSAPPLAVYHAVVTPVGGTAITCDIDTTTSTSASCSKMGATVYTSDDSLTIYLTEAPKTAHLEVASGTGTIVVTDLSPAYSVVDEDCAASCRRGTAEVMPSP